MVKSSAYRNRPDDCRAVRLGLERPAAAGRGNPGGRHDLQTLNPSWRCRSGSAVAPPSKLYESLGTAERALWWQVTRLALSGEPQVRRLLRTLGVIVYAGWWWLVVATGFLIGSVAVLALPRVTCRWSALRRICRGALAAIGTPVSATGLERIPRRGAMLAFNHSRLDALALLHFEAAIVTKIELFGQLVAGPFLRRLGIPFVERNVSGSLADAQALMSPVKAGRWCSFQRRPSQ